MSLILRLLNTRRDMPRRDAGAAILAACGVTAAFGVASCCALPILLGSLGIGSAWLIAVAWLAAPHRLALLALAVVCLASGSGLLLWQRRRTVMCSPNAVRGRTLITVSLAAALSLGAVLTVLGFLYA